ncbi:MAG: YceI family protein [Cyclobacteriaceae bacterium]
MVRLLLPFLILGLTSTFAVAQSKYLSKTSEVTFFSSAPLEDISAINTAMAGIVDFESKEFLMRVPIIKFDFPNDLMEEHFNENYMETEKYPNATFKGSFTEEVNPSKQGQYTINCTGQLEVHGVAQDREIAVTLDISKNGIQANSSFTVLLEDHDIEIPTIVFKNIAEEIDVKINATFEPLKK